MQTSEHAPDAGDRGRTRPRGAYAKIPIAERRHGGRRFRQDGPQSRNSRQVRKASCHEAQEEFVESLAEPEELVRHDRPSPRQTSPLESGQCIYVFEDDTGFVIFTLYMDDVLLLGANKHLLTTLKKQIIDRHGMTDMGDMSRVLGMNVTRNRTKRTITNDQEDTTEDIAERFGMKGYYSAFKPGAGQGTFAQPTGAKSARQGRQAAGPVNRRRHHVPRRRFPVWRLPRRGSAGTGNVQTCRSLYKGHQASASLLGQVHRLLHHLQMGRL